MSRRQNAYRRAGFWVSGTGWTASPEPAPAPETPTTLPPVVGPPAPDELRHGYTLTDLHRLAQIATRVNTHMAGDIRERYELAWSGIAEYLCAAEEAPTRRELVDVGSRTLNRWMHGIKSMHGMSDAKGGGFGSAPHFATYWWDLTSQAQSHEGKIVELIALRQIFPRLTPREQRALIALATFGSLEAGAEALGISYYRFRAAVKDARDHFRRHWHQGEKPSRHWMQDKVGSQGENATKHRRHILATRLRRSRPPGGRSRGHSGEDDFPPDPTPPTPEAARELDRRILGEGAA